MFNNNCCVTVMFMLIMLVMCKYLLGYMKCPWPLPHQMKFNIEKKIGVPVSGCQKVEKGNGIYVYNALD